MIPAEVRGRAALDVAIAQHSAKGIDRPPTLHL